MAVFAPPGNAVVPITLASLVRLAGLGSLSAVAGGAPPARAALRVTFWGALAMGLTAGAGWVFGLAI